jgi:hypothetical protein
MSWWDPSRLHDEVSCGLSTQVPMRRLAPILLPLLSACQDAGLQKHNSPPTATITSPAEGTGFQEDDTVPLVGAVSDPNDDANDLQVTWTADGATICAGAAADATGVTTCELAVEAGTVTIGLQVRDPAGSSATDALTLEVTETGAPDVALTSPEPDARHYADEPVLLAATATDTEDGPEDLRATWTSTLDGDLLVDTALDGDDTTSLFASLTAGTHGLTVVVTDQDGKTGRAQATVVVGATNSAPTCSITAPDEGDQVELGVTLSLDAYVADADQPPEELTIEWRSDADGALGTPTAEATGDTHWDVSTLSAGAHTLTLSVEDERGERCSDARGIIVGGPPDVLITAPAGGTVANDGDTITFAATVSDGQDAPSDLGLSWVSDRDGEVDTTATSTGAAGFATDTLSVGAHTVTLTATDTVGLTGSDAVSFRVNGLPSAPTVAITPASPDSTDDLTAAISVAATDPEGDAISYTWSWTRGGTATSHTTAAIPAADTTRAEVWVATATPSDGYGSGTAGDASVTIGNAAPIISSVTLSPTSPETDDTVSATVVSSDPDGDSVSYTYAWTVNSTAVAGTTASLSGVTAFDKWDVVGLSVTPSDTSATGAAVAATPVTAINTPPEAPGVSIDPSAPDGTADIVCTIDTASYDADSDSITYVMTWEVDGVTYPDDPLDSGDTGFAWDGPTTTTWTDDTVPADDVALGETWVCTATPDDGDDTGTAGTASATVATGGCTGGTTSLAYTTTVNMYGFCFYLAKAGNTCDAVCAAVGGTNRAWAAESAWADACSAATSADVVTWFYNNGNPAGWSSSTATTNGHTLGYGYPGGSRYGKCSTGTAQTTGTYPGEPNRSATRTPVCACF